MTNINLLPPDTVFKENSPNKRNLKVSPPAKPASPPPALPSSQPMKAAELKPNPQPVPKPTTPSGPSAIKKVVKAITDFEHKEIAKLSHLKDRVAKPVPQAKSLSEPSKPLSQVKYPEFKLAELNSNKDLEKKKLPPSAKAKSSDPEKTGLEINFIQTQVSPYASANFLKRLFVGGLILCSELALIFGGYFLFNKYYLQIKQNSVAQIDAQVESLKKEIAVYSGDKQSLTAFQKKLSAFGSLLSQHIHWSTFMNFMEDKTLPDIYYTSIAVDGNRVTLVGKSNNYTQVAKQLTVFSDQKEILSDVSVKRLLRVTDKTGRDLISFDMDLTLVPGYLQK